MCRNEVKFAVKIQTEQSKKKSRGGSLQNYVQILSYIDFTENRLQNYRRGDTPPKYKEHIITEKTKWIIENTDYSGMMNEFRAIDMLKSKAFSKEKQQQQTEHETILNT